mmetsp:Transcript_11268/g.39162  ORF Transcript_11268/g.39162 Transcript_11268/m.39162 type:complete len:98 (+) Transcript_11268:2-295(+)
MDAGPTDGAVFPFCVCCYTRAKYRFTAAASCVVCPGGRGCYCCVRGVGGEVGTRCCPCCLPFVCRWFRVCRSNPCCLCASTWAHDSIDNYLAIQLAQ